MRSSIACIRCRRSKVKCVNSGVGTTCRACENSGRECTYPPPVVGGGSGQPRRPRDESLNNVARPDPLSTAGLATASASNNGLNSGHPGGAGASNVTGGGNGGGGANESSSETRRVRVRKTATNNFIQGHSAAGARDSPRLLLDALDSKLLTPAIWLELFEIFVTHYSADLPFLHQPTFVTPLRAAPPASIPRPRGSTIGSGDSESSAVRPPGSPPFLLAFLALTARFHPLLVAHHSPPTSKRPSDPLVASQYYANIATESLAATWAGEPVRADIERTQALLMLSLHEWGTIPGARAWITLGAAIRSAQALGLQFEADLNDEPWSRSVALTSDADRSTDTGLRRPSGGSSGDDTDEFVRQEMRRRTFWSCFIMDRHLSSGAYRPQMLRVDDLRIQLPASERSFMFAERVTTLMLGEEDRIISRGEIQGRRLAAINVGSAGRPDRMRLPPVRSIVQQHNDDERARMEVGADEGLVSRYIKMLDIYGRIVKWACAGGRQNEQHPPWDQRCTYSKLQRQCLTFKTSLPRQHALTMQNTQAHISLKTATPYVLVHLAYLLGQIILNREYLPFIPLVCSRPEGPLDPPVFPHDRFDVPSHYWESAARECFRNAREIIDLARALRDWNALVETPMFVFAIHSVAFLGVYSVNFPWMDPDGYLCTPAGSYSRPEVPRRGESKGFEATRKALEMLGSMRSRLRTANGWYRTAIRTHKYFQRMKVEFRRNSGQGDLSGSPHHPGRDANSDLPSEEIRQLERALKEFSGPNDDEDEDVEMTDATARGGSSPTADPSHDSGSVVETVKSEEIDQRGLNPQLPRSDGGPWNAINAASSTPGHQMNASTSSSGVFRAYDTWRPSSQPMSQTQQQSTPAYGSAMPNFRPVHPSFETPPQNSAGMASPSSKRSPGSGRPRSPSFDRPGYHGWQPHQSTPSYQKHPSPAPHTNGGQTSVYAPSYPGQMSTSNPSQQAYPSKEQLWESTHLHVHPHQQQQQPPQPPMQLEMSWPSPIDTRLGADDLAAFIENGDVAEWAAMSASRADGGGWLSAVWA